MAARVDPVTRYARAVTKGKVIAGPYVRLACERHLRDLKRKDLDWRPAEAQRAIDFFAEMLVLEDGRPFVLLDYQEFIVGSLFGWYGSGGFRRFRSAYVEMGKGTGKSPLAAGVGLKLAVADGEPAPEVYSAATTRDQAKIVWKDAKGMVERSPELADLISVQVGSLTIAAENAVFRPVSSEHRGLDGLRVHGGLIDELHEHSSAMVVDKIRAGTKARRNALIFEITNSGFDRTSVCWQHHELSVQVLERTVDNDAWFAYVCSLDEGDDWRDERVWLKANPGLGKVLPVEYLREQVAEAVSMPSKENIVKRLNFCMWTEQSERWLEMGAWDKCGGAMVKWESFRGRRCFAGLDMAARADLCAAAYVFPDSEGGFDVLMRFWIPEETIAAKDSGRAEQDRLMLQSWAGQGFLTVTQGNVTDYDLVEEQLLKDAEMFDLVELAHDRWNVTQLVTHLQDALGVGRVVAFPQSMASMSSPSKELEKLVASGKIRHGGHPVLRWNAANVSLRYGPDQQIKPDRESSRDKIDGIIALIMALGRAQVSQGDGRSVYEERGLVVL